MEQVHQCIDNLLNLSYESVASCAKHTEYDAFREGKPNTTSIYLLKPKTTCAQIERCTDLLVGFMAHGDVDIELCTSKFTLSRYQLRKGQFVYAINYNYMLPIISIRFEMVSIKIHQGTTDDISVVYGCSHNTDVRRFIASNFTKSGAFYFGHGMCKTTVNADCIVHEMPSMRTIPTLQEYMTMSKDRTKTILEEFAALTWNPWRVRMWCLPYDDCFALTSECSYNNVMTRLWLDDILVIDGFEVKYETMNLTLRSNIHELLKLQNMEVCGQVRHVKYKSGEGMHVHKDHSLEGGTHSFIVYLEDNAAGHICFPHNNLRIIPRRNRVVIFDVELLHYVDPCCEPKEIITGECVFVTRTTT